MPLYSKWAQLLGKIGTNLFGLNWAVLGGTAKTYLWVTLWHNCYPEVLLGLHRISAGKQQIALDIILTSLYTYILSFELDAAKRRISVKTKVVWFIAAFIVAPLLPLCYGQANQPANISGYNPGNNQAYTYSVTNSGQPQNNGTVQYGGAGAYTAGPAPARQPVVVQPPVQPRVAYQQTIPQTQVNPQLQPLSKAVPKKKPVQSARAANANRLLTAQPSNQQQQIAAARQYQPNYPAQPRPVVQQRYYQQPQTGYYSNPYQTQYSANPNYYQGYYNNWGSSGQACAPGKA